MLSRAKVCQSYPFFVPLFSGVRGRFSPKFGGTGL